MPWPSGAVAASGPVNEKLPPILISVSLTPWSGYLLPPACGPALVLQAVPSSATAASADTATDHGRHVGRNHWGVRMKIPPALKSSANGARNADDSRRLKIDHH